MLANVSQWGRIFAEVDDLGTLKTVEVTPTPLSSNPIDVPLFDTTMNRSRGSCSSANICTQRSCANGSVGPNTSYITLRSPVAQEHSRLLQQQQQQFHVQELAARQMQNARRQGFPQSQFLGSLLTENCQRPRSVQLPGPRYSYPYVFEIRFTAGLNMTERPCVSPYTIPAGQIIPYASQRMFCQIVNCFADIHRVSNIQLTNSQAGSSLSGTPFAPGTHASSLLRRSGESLMQTSRLNIANPLPITSSNSVPTFSFSSAVQTIPSSVVTADIQPADSLNNSIVCTQNDGTPAQHDRSGVCFNSPVLNLGITPATQQKCAPSELTHMRHTSKILTISVHLWSCDSFLENCITIIKAKKVSSERSLNGLQRPATVQFKPDTEHMLANVSQWGRIFAEVDDLGTLKTVSSCV
ncbi:hypothetical protein WUBG_11728 [Wuchereria bancrofti]|uniref:Uncharacterized protein n=1 Tax=Wuchereria bancrofti TaxID=6293 RepID=J9E4Z8_WUCBA|nr:hypothetical protein WUBG_11728 [Wuchereria bancrofti]